jgi:uncharacterized membrane protein
MKERLKSPVVWLSVLAQICIILAFFIPNDINDMVKVIGTAVVEIMTLFGVLNNPTERSEF